MNIEFDSYKQKLTEIRPALEGLAESINLDGLRNELERLHAMQPQFYECIPLTLEEIFIAEMEENGYDFTEILA